MYIVRWLLSHPIIATWVALSVVAILLIFGSGDKEEELTSEASMAPSTDVIKTVVSSTEEKASVDTAKKEKTAKVVDTDEAKKIADLNVSVTAEPIPPLKSELDKVSSSDDLSSTKNASIKSTESKNTESKSTAITDLSQATNEEMLLMAREAYWNNGLDEAAQIYSKLIEKEPKAFEYKGELGNVYWRQGYPKKAAELYSEISIPMIENGGSERVANMIGFIGLFYPDRAAVIHEKMQSTK
jgi:tetratricopeptide (TPR) repeat protein